MSDWEGEWVRVTELVLVAFVSAALGFLGLAPARAEGVAQSLVPSEGETWLERGRQALAEGAVTRAQDCLSRSFLLSLREQPVLVKIGVAFSEIEQWTEAEHAFRRSLSLKPQDAAALNGLGYVFYRNQQVERAIACYRQAIALVPAPQYELNLGLAFLEQERWGDAEDAFRRAIREEPLNYWAHNNLGYALDNQGLTDQAIAEYRLAAGVSTGDLTAHGNLGALLMREQAWREAASVYETVLKADDTLAEAHLGLAESYVKLRRYRDAQREAAIATAIEPHSARAWYVKSMVLAQMGQRAEALRLVLKSLERDDGDWDAHFLCAQLAKKMAFTVLYERSMQALRQLTPGDVRVTMMGTTEADTPLVP